ncbi:MAG: peptidase [Pseudomonadales bacterium]|nr:peptidase [Pseudomonadales bacterium]
MCADPRSGVDAEGRAFPDVQGTTEDENNWLRSWSNELYLWYDEITDVDPASLSTPEYFDRMQTFETTPSGAPKDKFHFTIPTDEWQAQSSSGISGGYGATFAVLRGTPPREVVVAYTEPDTPATSPEVALLRGTEILEVDGADLVNGNEVETLNNGLFPGDNETHTFLVRDVGSTETRTITMTSTQITSTPVQNVTTLETDTGLVGYLTFNDHIRPAEGQLIDAINQLQAASVTDVVLDLRYNGGGFLDIANELGYMIAGDNAVGQVFEAQEFNDKHPDFDPVTGRPLQPEEFHTTTQGFSVSAGQPLPTLGLNRVFILSGPGTCSASESIINGLRGIDVEVVMIGDTTCGKPYGFYAFDNCGTTYFSIQFRGVNQKGFGDYSDGFSPENTPTVEGTPVAGCLVSDDFTRQLGDPEEGRLKAALQYHADGSCPTIVGTSATAARGKARPGESLRVDKSAWLTNRILIR